MKELLELIKKRNEEYLDGEKVSVDVPEWGTKKEPMKVYVNPLSLYGRDRLVRCINSDKNYEALVEIIIMCAADVNGKRLFKDDFKEEFMKTDVHVSVVETLGMEMLNGFDLDGTESVNQTGKN